MLCLQILHLFTPFIFRSDILTSYIFISYVWNHIFRCYVCRSYICRSFTLTYFIFRSYILTSYVFIPNVCRSYMFWSYVCWSYILTSFIFTFFICTCYILRSYIFISNVCRSCMFWSYVCWSYIFTGDLVFSLSLSLFFSLFCYFYSFLRRGSGHKRLRKCDGSVRSEVWCSKLPKIEILNCPGRPLRRKWGSIVQNRAKKKQFGLVVQDCNAQNDIRSSKNWLYFGSLGSRFPSIVWYLLVEYWGKRLCVKRIDVQQGLCEKTFVCKRLCL